MTISCSMSSRNSKAFFGKEAKRQNAGLEDLPERI